MPLAIRGARPDDAADVARLNLQLGYSRAPQDVAASLSRVLARDAERFWIAEHEGAVVGWIHAVAADYVDVERYVLIAGLVVDASARRGGVGRALLATAEEWARDQGCRVVRLTSSATRTEAHKFHERVGYTNIKTQYSFAKAVAPDAGPLQAFVPKVG